MVSSLSLPSAAPAPPPRPITPHWAWRGVGTAAILVSLDALCAVPVLWVGWLLGYVGETTATLFVPCWVITVAGLGGYRGLTVRDWARPMITSALALPTAVLVVTETTGLTASATTLLLLSLATAALGSVGRTVMWVAARHGTRVPGLTYRAVIVGGARTAEQLPTAQHLDPRLDVVGLCLPERPSAAGGEMPIFVGLEQCADAVAALDADTVLVAADGDLDPVAVRRLRWRLEGCGVQVFVATDLVDVAPRRTRVDIAGGRVLLQIRETRHRSPARWLADLTQRVTAGVALLLLAPLLLLLAVLIRSDSPGPVFFRQTRIGRDGRPFTMWKLRTMERDAEAARAAMPEENDGAGVLFKLHADPRITRVGVWLRRLSLDELPQLINVALGEMTLIGPRPALPDEVARYPDDVRRRLVVKPGITGLWQVSGRSDLSWEESVRLDQYYVDNWSWQLDVMILWRTVGAVLRGRGAY